MFLVISHTVHLLTDITRGRVLGAAYVQTKPCAVTIVKRDARPTPTAHRKAAAKGVAFDVSAIGSQ